MAVKKKRRRSRDKIGGQKAKAAVMAVMVFA